LGGAATYYTFVRPLTDQRSTNVSQGIAIRRLEQEQRERRATSDEQSEVGDTGHRSGFMTQNRYFNTLKQR
jgi:hypothetical protein